jgi:hypothetical protein
MFILKIICVIGRSTVVPLNWFIFASRLHKCSTLSSTHLLCGGLLFVVLPFNLMTGFSASSNYVGDIRGGRSWSYRGDLDHLGAAIGKQNTGEGCVGAVKEFIEDT